LAGKVHQAVPGSIEMLAKTQRAVDVGRPVDATRLNLAHDDIDKGFEALRHDGSGQVETVDAALLRPTDLFFPPPLLDRRRSADSARQSPVPSTIAASTACAPVTLCGWRTDNRINAGDA
jgi:hypothetical protein